LAEVGEYDQLAARVVRPGTPPDITFVLSFVHIKHISHVGNELAALLGRNYPTLFEVRAKLVFFSVFLTVSCEILATMPESTILSLNIFFHTQHIIRQTSGWQTENDNE